MNDPQQRFQENNIISSFNAGQISRKEMNKKLYSIYKKTHNEQLPPRIQ